MHAAAVGRIPPLGHLPEDLGLPQSAFEVEDRLGGGSSPLGLRDAPDRDRLAVGDHHRLELDRLRQAIREIAQQLCDRPRLVLQFPIDRKLPLGGAHRHLERRGVRQLPTQDRHAKPCGRERKHRRDEQRRHQRDRRPARVRQGGHRGIDRPLRPVDSLDLGLRNDLGGRPQRSRGGEHRPKQQATDPVLRKRGCIGSEAIRHIGRKQERRILRSAGGDRTRTDRDRGGSGPSGGHRRFDDRPAQRVAPRRRLERWLRGGSGQHAALGRRHHDGDGSIRRVGPDDRTRCGHGSRQGQQPCDLGHDAPSRPGRHLNRGLGRPREQQPGSIGAVVAGIARGWQQRDRDPMGRHAAEQMRFGLQTQGLLGLLAGHPREGVQAADRRRRWKQHQAGAHLVAFEPGGHRCRREAPLFPDLDRSTRRCGGEQRIEQAVSGAAKHRDRVGVEGGASRSSHGSRYIRIWAGTVERSTVTRISTSRPVVSARPRLEIVNT